MRFGTMSLSSSLAALLLMTGCRGASIGSINHSSNEGGAPGDGDVAKPSGEGQTPPREGMSPTGDPVLPPGDPGVTDVTFEIRTEKDQHPISPLIYGINHNLKGADQQRWGAIRAGGNRHTAYNWENNASNAGADWHFQNDALMSQSDSPAEPLLGLIDAAAKLSAPTIITLPNSDYVAADKNGDGDVRASGPDYLTTRFKRNLPKKPTPFSATPDKSDDAVYQDELVAFLKAQRPQATLLFSMDNEPELWSHTHAEIFPRPVTYADLWRRNHAFAKAAKEAWSSAEVLGFVSYGYLGFVSLQNASDAGGRNFIEWYLDQAKAAEKSEGRRLIDYLDLHWYPEAQGGGQRIVSDQVGAEVVAARVQAPRSLWDAQYEEDSWIRESAGGPIDLLHWVKAKIDNHYPGTKLSFTEWNFGGGNHMSGAVAVCDVLGIFGRYGVDLANYWEMIPDESFAFAGFRAYRNYDGQGAAFGDTSVRATNTDPVTASVYGSVDSKDPTRTVIVAINKTSNVKRAGIKIAHSVIYASAKVYALSGAQAAVGPSATLLPVATNAFRYEMPALSVSVIVPQQ
jgi:hypothetical protein